MAGGRLAATIHPSEGSFQAKKYKRGEVGQLHVAVSLSEKSTLEGGGVPLQEALRKRE